MYQREDILNEGLQKNKEEFQRWQTYLKENETAVENMTMFGKRLIVDVMVPVGKKAFMPGHLLHTNELLVGHYQGYFSKCTTSKAKEICELRIKMAKQYLTNLEIEAEMWRNKLLKPHTEGVLPSGEELEIIEEYDEDTENVWKEKHRILVKLSKVNEREEREKSKNSKDNNEEKTNEEIFKMLEESALLEELEQELDTLQVDEVNDEIIRKLISGEMKLPQEKRRRAHGKSSTMETSVKFLPSNILKENYIENNSWISTNNNTLPNPEIIKLATSEDDMVEEETLPEEVILIKEQAKYLNAEDQIGFYNYQIQIVKQKLQLVPLRTQEEINEKIYLLNALEHLEDLLEEAEETVGETELNEKVEDEDNGEEIENCEKFQKQASQKCVSEIRKSESSNRNKCKEKRCISFDLKDQTLEFRNHEAVAQMLPPKIDKTARDIIKLNNYEEPKDDSIIKAENSLSKSNLIHATVEKNLQFMNENQSKQDFDLVHQILESSKGDFNTLHIKFKHSHKDSYTCKDISNTIGNPADFFNLTMNSEKTLENSIEPSTLFVNSYEGEEQVKVPLLKEADRQSGFTDPKSEFSNPLRKKSILKNKIAVDKERHYGDKHQENNNKIKTPKKKSSKNGEVYLSAYNKVMNDVIDKGLTEPEPLPDVKFIDAHTPKKRISRFKQIRQGNEKT